MYDNDGNEITNQNTIYTGDPTSSISKVVATDTNTFTLPPNGTRTASFFKATPQNIQGYAVIKWESQNSKISKALIATHKLHEKNINSVSATSAPVNSGQPF